MCGGGAASPECTLLLKEVNTRHREAQIECDIKLLRSQATAAAKPVTPRRSFNSGKRHETGARTHQNRYCRTVSIRRANRCTAVPSIPIGCFLRTCSLGSMVLPNAQA